MAKVSILHIVITGLTTEIDIKSNKRISDTFESLFGDSANKVSHIKTSENIEIIYEIRPPLFDDDESFREFYSDLEVLFEELKEFAPHFTQFRRV